MSTRAQQQKNIARICNLAALAFILLPVCSLLIGSIQTENVLISNVDSPLPKEITLRNFIVLHAIENGLVVR